MAATVLAPSPLRGILHVIHGHGGGTEHHARALIDATRTRYRHHLAIAIGRDAGKVTRFIQRLEAKRLVINDIDRRDRRLSIIRPTAKGRTLAENLASVLGNSRKDLFASIPESDAHRVGHVLRQLYQNAVPIDQVHRKSSRGPYKEQVPELLAVSLPNGSREKATETFRQARTRVIDPHQEFALK